MDNQPTRREALKQALKATAYVAPAVIAVARAPLSAQVSGPACRTTFAMNPDTSSSLQWAPVLTGTGFTPNGQVTVDNISGWTGHCRGIVIVPGTSFQADATGRFNLVLPKTALNFSVVTDLQVFPITVTDVTTGCSSTANYTITPITQSPADSLTLTLADSQLTSVLAPPSPPLPGENGSGTVLTGQCQSAGVPIGGISPTGATEFRITLTGATPNRTFSLFVQVPGFVSIPEGAQTTDAAGNLTVAFYTLQRPSPSGCLPALGSSSVLSFTTDGNPPGATNVAYRTTLVRNNIRFC
jgi:hypothetical protein